MDLSFFLPAAISCFVVVMTVPIVMLAANRFGFVDQPSARKVHQNPIPRIGGLAILAGLLAGSLVTVGMAWKSETIISHGLRNQLIGLGVGSLFIALVGFVDDVRNISSRFKLAALLFASVLISGSGASILAINLGGKNVVEFQWLAFFLTILWISGICVAVNFIDGLDGLASGLVFLSSIVLAFFLIGSGHWLHGGIAISLAGAQLGFLVYNRYPARIFMGDCGSMLIGFCIASLMVMSNPLIGSMRAILLPSLALSIPIADGTFTFFRRHYLQRRSIFAAERGHIHHRLLDRGFRHPQAVWVIYLVSIGAVFIGLVALAFEGIATLAGLSLLVPLIYGTFRFAGSVRTSEMLSALRTKRDLDRASKKHRASFESFQLELDKVESFGDWWECICRAAEDLDFKRLELSVNHRGVLRKLKWESTNESLFSLEHLHASVPIVDGSQFGGHSQLAVDIAVTQTMEQAGQRLSLISRLISETSLSVVRMREQKKQIRNRQSQPTSLLDNLPAEKSGKFGSLRVAVVHDFFYTYCGAERVVEQIINLFPHADVFALFDFLPDGERGFLKGKHVTTSFIQHLPMAKRIHRSYLPLMPLAIEQLDVSQYDLVISSSYLAAKGVLTGPDQLHVCYCHSPVRYAWDLHHQYLRQSNLGFGPKGLLARMILHYLRSWDIRSSLSVDQFIANSHFVARRIKKLYRRQATVIHPPVDTERFKVNSGEREDFYLVAGRMVPYKRTEMMVRAFTRMPNKKLVVIGDGPDMEKVRAVAGVNVQLLGFQESDVLIDHMRRAKAIVFSAEEDFGIVPVEALSCGTPVIAYGKGGVTESVIDGKHGIFFDEQTEAALMDAVERFEAKSGFGVFSPDELHARSLQFSSQRFLQEMESAVGRWLRQQGRWISEGRDEGEKSWVRSDAVDPMPAPH